MTTRYNLLFPRQHKAKQNGARRYVLIFLFVVTAFNIHGLCEVISYTQCSAPVYPRCARLRWSLESKLLQLLQLRCQPIVRYATLFLTPLSCQDCPSLATTYYTYTYLIIFAYPIRWCLNEPPHRWDLMLATVRRDERLEREIENCLTESNIPRHAASWPVNSAPDISPSAARQPPHCFYEFLYKRFVP